MTNSSPSRRIFLQALGTSAAFAACAGGSAPPPSAPAKAAPKEPPKGPGPGAPREEDIELPAGAAMPMRRLGRTGVQVSLLGLGGWHLSMPKDPQESVRIVRFALDHGVTFLDNCWDYHAGESERRMGTALQDGYRQKAFLMTKVDGRTRAAAEKQLEQSLQRLRTDVIDLVQIHEVIRMSDPAQVFGPGGAVEGLVEAKKAGKLRFIGFTGHKDPSIHLAMLQAARDHGFTFDTVQMPLNVMDPHYRSFEKEVLPVLVENDIGVLGMKPFGAGLFIESKVATPMEYLHYPMSLPTSVVITGCDSMGVLKQALKAAYTWKPLEPAQVADLLARTAAVASRGAPEQFKTTERFDGTTKNPKWLTTADVSEG